MLSLGDSGDHEPSMCYRHWQGGIEHKLRVAREPAGSAVDDRCICAKFWPRHRWASVGLCWAKDHGHAG